MNFASLYNYYEHLVFDYISRQLVGRYTDADEEFFLDVACYALTRLPSRYIRHEIDMVYYLAPGELDAMEQNVKKTVDQAAEFISERISQKARQ
ncbi:MAG: late competence development ComFB family protein [Gammaproteobacteria bacterium]|nr:late competence development ComFB family protein [Gammaproteobacteria bacterium]